MTLEDGKSPPLLEYAGKTGLNEQRGARLMGWYWLGMVAGMFVLGVLVLNKEWRGPSEFGAMKKTALLVGVLGSLHVVPATFGMSLGLWLRQRRGRAVHFRGAVAPLIWGFLGFALWGLIPSSIVTLAVTILYCVVAGFCLGAKGRQDETECILLQRRYGRYLRAMGMALAILVLGGYLSAWISREACEQRLAHDVAMSVFRGKPFQLSSHPAQGAERIFRSGGYGVLPAGTNRDDKIPWGDVGNTRMEFPFMVSVEYGWVAAPRVGSGGRVRFICFFGWMIEFEEGVEWVT